MVVFQRKPHLVTLCQHPTLVVNFSFNEHHRIFCQLVVPPEADQSGVLFFDQPHSVQVQVLVVVVHRRGRLAEVVLPPEREDREVFDNITDHLHHIVALDPEFEAFALKHRGCVGHVRFLLLAVFGLVQMLVLRGQPHQQALQLLGVAEPVPLYLPLVRRRECVVAVLVVLLQDGDEEVDVAVDVLFKPQNVAGELLCCFESDLFVCARVILQPELFDLLVVEVVHFGHLFVQ
mmetsp:Transcript_6078/g.11510  ORF Transcript_6078/g.11510 Transcript_6078/m.11510 type:complete len:233 (+) Transcript_6078:2575-3273(+)